MHETTPVSVNPQAQRACLRLRSVPGWLPWSIAMLAQALLAGACSPPSMPLAPPNTAPTAVTHSSFQISSGVHAVDCNSCHGSTSSFKQFDCLGCHAHQKDATDGIHTAVPPVLGTYSFSSQACYSCHQNDDGKRHAFSHTGIVQGCALCHGDGASFAALPVPGFTHQPIGSADCSGCHSTVSWKTSTVPGLVSDPAMALTVTAQEPTWSGTSISSFTNLTQALPMPMLHGSSALGAAAQSACTNCHAEAESGIYYPGELHASLDRLKLAQPTSCAGCHASSTPAGFVGPMAAAPPRTPQSGEMKHDAVVWNVETQTTTPLVTQDCSVCHLVPAPGATAPWRTGTSGSVPAQFHASLARAGLAQPTSCNDCHANNRPALLTSANAALPPGLNYDHTIAPAQADCAGCHASTSSFKQWAGGRFHHAGAASPTSCLPCHAGERPSAAINPTSTWKSATYSNSPFDYATNAQGITHGNGNDCAACHSGPGTGAWGGTQTWAGAFFPHGAGTDATSTCIACHASQRPDLQPGTVGSTAAAVLNFDHSINGTGDCFGCHQATVAAKAYTRYAFPGGDWKSGQSYPGSNLIGSPSQFVITTEMTLLHTSPSNPALVTGMSSLSATLYNQFLHTSSAIPGAFGLAASPDVSKCWHCHTNDGAGHVTAFANGQFHPALDSFRATPGGVVTPQPQPTAHCSECHTQRPANIVEKPVGTPPVLSDLQPMDHAALFVAAVNIGGVQASGVASLECSTCHSHPGAAWTDGTFHKNIGAAVPRDCNVCHYPLMADTAASNKPGRDAMKHGSTQVTAQNCRACHTGALAQATGAPIAPTLWSGGTFHLGVPAQPSACLDCHGTAWPASATASATIYAMPLGGSSSNGTQWMSHAAPVAGQECAICHLADAKASGSTWSKNSLFHAHATPTTCQGCHGLGNGSSAAGTNNNLPAGLTNSSTLTTASNDSATGIPAGTFDQILHSDTNVAARDCNFCHTQVGPSKTTGVQGKEWTQARFHANFTGAVQLVIDGNGARCSNCHMNVKPAASFTAYDHAALSNVPGTVDCAACHHPGSNWLNSVVPVTAVSDRTHDLTVNALIPTWSGTSIAQLTAQAEKLTMPMLHNSTAVGTIVFNTCSNCHTNAGVGSFYPGAFHASLVTLNVTQPTACAGCHAASTPTGFVGPTATAPARNPPSGEMKHDAVAWNQTTRTNTPLVTQDCGLCHKAPVASVTAPWTVGTAPSTTARYHASLTAANQPQPASCNDCHANTRPTSLTSANAALPPGLSYDHTIAPAQADCAGCHASTSSFTRWAGGRFHHAGAASPTSCLPCHAGERPSAAINPTSAWMSTTYPNSPFDYLTNAQGITHGNGKDCAVCHTGPGTGAWGGTQTWASAFFPHGAGTSAASTCIACHASQRPDLQPGTVGSTAAAVLNFDHSVNGTGDCIGCHGATVAAGSYVRYTFPGGDWKGGQGYPGSSLVGSPTQFVTLTESTLLHTSPSNPSLVTGVSSLQATLYNQFLHTSSIIPGAFGLAASPDLSKCWHCHTNDGAGHVTSFANGQYHPSLDRFTATPGRPITPLPQPTSQCADCHTQRPAHIVEAPAGSPPVLSDLLPMDHAALFVSTVNIGGVPASGAGSLDCADCHTHPGVAWTDGNFHKSIGAAVPQDCTVCHYPLMADAVASDKASGGSFAMKHASVQLTFQNCQTCHSGALAKAKGTPIVAALFSGGAFHPSVAVQPAACADCHAVSKPAAATQSSVQYVFAAGGTATNGAQWMSHASLQLSGLDCATCHAADARASGSAWSKADSFHAAVASPSSCRECHGITNGGGGTPGTNNNLPAGLTDSSTLTTAANDPTTGVPPGTHDQISHADVNASSHDCKFCHTQEGVSSTPGIRGKEWAQASFHSHFTGTVALDMTNGRCSNCHLNVKPGTSYASFDHSAIGATGTDCSNCHRPPPVRSDWLGAAGAPATFTAGGFTIAPNLANATEPAITLPHPVVTTACTTCHTSAAGGKNAIGFDHANAGTNCKACHEAGTNLLSPVWNGSTSQNGGHGDSRPFTITTLTSSNHGNSCQQTNTRHFYPVDCYQCHMAPTGIVTGTSYQTNGSGVWTFPQHDDQNVGHMTQATCQLCHPTPCP